MSYKISSPEKFMTDIIPMEVLLTICLALKYRNPDIEDLVLNIIPDWEDLDKYFVMDELASRLFNDQSFDSMIAIKKHKSDLISSISFLLKGCSSKKANLETEEYISSMDLDETNVFPAFCKSLLLLCEVFLSDHKHFSYENYNFDRDLVLISDLELNEIYNSNEIVEIDSNPIFGKSLENKFNVIDDKFSKMESNFFKMESNLEKIMSLLVSMTSNDSKNPVSAPNAYVKISSVLNDVKTPLVRYSQRKDPKIQKSIQKPKSSSPKPDKGNLYSPLVLNNDNDDEDDDDDIKSVSKSDSFNDDEIEEYSDEDSSLFSNSNAYTTSEITFIKDQTLLWKSNIPNLTNPREIHALSSLAENKGLLIAQASGQLVQMKFPKTLKCNQNLFTLGSKYIDCQTNILFPRSFPEMCTYFSETILILQRLVGGDIECDSDTMNWATKMIQFFPRYTSQLSIKFNHGYNRNYSITQYAILLRLHLWCMNVTVINKNPSFLSKVDSIWDKFIRYDFEAYPTNEKLLSACALVGYRCTTCHKLFVPTQLCPVCFSLQTISKAVGPFTSKTQLEKDYQLWLSSPEGIAWVTSNVKSKAWDHYYSKIATATQRDSHNKIKKSGSSPKFTSLSKCLGHYAANQHEIPLLCGSDHHTK